MSAIVRQRLITIRDEMNLQFLERREFITFILLTILTKQHAFILGPPGTAKSEAVRNFVGRLDNINGYFEVLLSRTRPDAAVLGPWNLPLLRDQGLLRRNKDGMLQTCEIAFLDEIGKMGTTLGHDLLSLLNERIFHEPGEGGQSVHPAPLYTAFTASNELIVKESDDAAALWDRLLMRILVDWIQNPSNFAHLLRQARIDLDLATAVPTTVDWNDLRTVIDTVIPAIDIPDTALETVIRLRSELKEQHGIVVSDRRWKQSMRVLQASAWLDDRSEVQDDDVNVLRYTLWEDPTQIPTVERLALTVSNPMAEKIMKLLDGADEIMAGVTTRKGQSLESRARYGAEAHGKLQILTNELGQLRQDALSAGRSTQQLDDAQGRLSHIRQQVYIECLDMSPEAAAKQS